MKKAARVVINLICVLAVLIGLAPATVQAAGDPIEPPPHWLYRGHGESHLASPMSSHAPSDQAPAMTLPVPSTCVAYASFDTSTLQFDLSVFNPQSGLYQRITSSLDNEIGPHFNHGCTRIVYTDDPGGSSYEDLYLINPDGTGKQRLTQNQNHNYDPACSRDGSKIAFTSERDGQPEIYVMNADGSNQVRLTNNAGDASHNFDDMPAWSPDGTKIAFVSNRTGGYRIWVMNANGSNLIQLTNEPHSFDPQWSPDGSKILYDAGALVNNTYFQRLYAIDVNTKTVQFVYLGLGADQTTDALTGGWSPDGKYIYFSIVNWIKVSNNWYWTEAYSYYTLLSDPVSKSALTLNSVDWFPSWETYDNQAPVAVIISLPPISGSPFTVSWGAQDISQYNMTFDVQYQDNQGPWQDLRIATMTTSLSFNGFGGHTYGFRVRAKDGFFQQSAWPAAPQMVTMVENLPPITEVTPLQPFTQGTTIYLRWSGQDQGGSGIAGYDVQYQDTASNTWSTLVTNTTETIYPFSASISGHKYYFRVHATDRANNQEDWQTNPVKIATTTFYASEVGGVLQDASGIPISGVTPDFSTPPFINPPTSADGSYQAYFAANPPGQTMTLSEPGYGDLPPINLDNSAIRNIDVYLPPADNVVANGGFETGSFSPSDWIPGGDLPPAVVSSNVHSGTSAARLGFPGGVQPPLTVGGSYTQYALDSFGNAFAVWVDNTGTVYFAYHPLTGDWETSILAGPSGYGWPYFHMEVDSTGGFYLFWWTTSASSVAYQYRSPTGSWSNILAVPGTYAINIAPVFVIDANDQVHVVWSAENSGSYSIKYTALIAGNWTMPVTIGSIQSNTPTFKMATGANGRVALIYSEYTISPSIQDVYYMQKDPGSNWTAPLNLSNASTPNMSVNPFMLSVDGDGQVTLIWAWWGGAIADSYKYLHRHNDGQWTLPISLPTLPQTPFIVSLAFSENGDIHILMKENSGMETGRFYYSKFSPNGSWTTPVLVASDILQPARTKYSKVVLDILGLPHFYWIEWHTDGIFLYHSLLTSSGNPGTAELEMKGGSMSFIEDPAGPKNIASVAWNVEKPGGFTVYFTRYVANQKDVGTTLKQTIQVPEATTQPGLSFVYLVAGGDLPGNGFAVKITDSEMVTTTIFQTFESTTLWAHQWIDLSGWGGQEVQLSFSLDQAAGSPSASVYLDEVSVGSTYPDSWVRANPAIHALPGTQLTLPITFGNQGKVPADGSQLTLTLPAGVTFVSASLDPTSTTPDTISWDLGDLATQTGPTTIWVTLQVDAAVPGFTSLPYSVSLSSTDLETANNTASGQIIASLAAYLPSVKK